VIRVHAGEAVPESGNSGPGALLLEGTSYAPMQQGGSFLGEQIKDSQGLPGYRVEREAGIGRREAAVLFSANGHTYELLLRYPIGLSASQRLLTIYTAMVEGFQLNSASDPAVAPQDEQ